MCVCVCEMSEGSQIKFTHESWPLGTNFENVVCSLDIAVASDLRLTSYVCRGLEFAASGEHVKSA